MQIITNDEALLRFMPNTFATVKVEATFFEKLVPFLESAEQWLIENFVGTPELLTEISADTSMHYNFSNIIVCHALMNAVPSLDLVLTPNGFGVVSNQNVAPASKERVQRLIASLESNRDINIEMLLKYLPTFECWRSSKPYEYFSSTMFPNFEILYMLGINAHMWQKYQELQPQIVSIELSLAEEYFSPEQMAVWRCSMASNMYLILHERSVVNAVRSQIADVLRDKPINHRLMTDCVNTIRRYPDSFPEWHRSATAELYTPKVFKNKKKSGGYWW